MKTIKNWKNFNEGITNQAVIDEIKADIEEAKKSGDKERIKKLKNKLFTLTDGTLQAKK